MSVKVKYNKLRLVQGGVIRSYSACYSNLLSFYNVRTVRRVCSFYLQEECTVFPLNLCSAYPYCVEQENFFVKSIKKHVYENFC
jgi:hypothetical protein